MLGLLLYVLYVVICDTKLSPSCTVRCPGATDQAVLPFALNTVHIFSLCTAATVPVTSTTRLTVIDEDPSTPKVHKNADFNKTTQNIRNLSG